MPFNPAAAGRHTGPVGEYGLPLPEISKISPGGPNQVASGSCLDRWRASLGVVIEEEKTDLWRNSTPSVPATNQTSTSCFPDWRAIGSTGTVHAWINSATPLTRSAALGAGFLEKGTSYPLDRMSGAQICKGRGRPDQILASLGNMMNLSFSHCPF